MKLSIVSLGTVPPGLTVREGLAGALETARRADVLGFHRIWYAEHHSSPANAAHSPEVLIAAAAAQTHSIRVGSGAVLLNNYSPLKVAENFKQLEATFPGRIDLGLGRATSGPVLDRALRRDRDAVVVDDHAYQVSEVLAWLYNAFPADHPFAGNPLMPSVPETPEVWLLGSSPSSGALAAQLGIGYSFAGFINPGLAAQALSDYRREFQPTPFGSQEPRAMLAVNVTVADTPADAERLVLSPKGYYGQLSRGDLRSEVPAPEQADRELADSQRAEPTRIVDGRWPRFVAGDPDEVRTTLDEMLATSGADELIVQDLIARPEDRYRSHELLAEAFELEPRGQTTSLAPG